MALDKKLDALHLDWQGFRRRRHMFDTAAEAHQAKVGFGEARGLGPAFRLGATYTVDLGVVGPLRTQRRAFCQGRQQEFEAKRKSLWKAARF
jgi:hypothetical protein